MAYEPLDPTNDRTIVKPTPGGRPQQVRAAPMAQPVPAAAQVIDFDVAQLASASVNQVVGAAAPLINLVRQLRGSMSQPDPEGLRARAGDEMRAFERRILAAGVPPERARSAHYALCATVDDIALNTPWGAYSSWASNSLATAFHKDVTAGEKFFDLLNHSHKDPGTNRDLLALMYLCLSVGFEGRMRVIPDGTLELARMREGLYRTLRGVYGDFERELSPHWRGVEARHRPIRSALALWSIAAASLLLLIAAYMLFTILLNRWSDRTMEALAAAPPHPPATIVVQTVAPPPPPPRGPMDEVRTALDADIHSGKLDVLAAGTTMIVRIKNAGMFPSGSATLDGKYVDLIHRVAGALKDQGDGIIVTGHTDNVPIRTRQFPSNQALSQARAQAVADVLAETIPRERLKVVGKADTEPVVDNSTLARKEENRRTDLLVTGLTPNMAPRAPAPGDARP